MNTFFRLVVCVVVCCAVVFSAVSQQPAQPSTDIPALEAKANAGEIAAMVELGNAYWGGHGVAVDEDKGRVWFERAADRGSVEAQMLLGAAYMSGTHATKNREVAAKYLLQVAQRDHVDEDQKSSQALAQYWVALMYENGTGLEKSHENAIKFLQMAATNGNYPAQFDLASLYNEGKGGMPMDKALACALFEKAADQGYVKAMHNVGYCYQIGTGGKTDESKAIKYYTMAAEAGDARAEHNLGMLYGRAGQSDKAYFWLRVAESSSNPDSKAILDKLKPSLPAVQMAAAEKDVVAWLKAHPVKK